MTPMSQCSRSKEPKIIISNKLYDFLKIIITVISPSSTAFYITLCIIFGFELEVAAIVLGMVLTACVGVFLICTSKSYHLLDAHYDGRLLIKEGEEGELLYTLELNDDPEFIMLKTKISFKVVQEDLAA